MKITLVEDPEAPTSPTLNPVSLSPQLEDDASERSGSPFEGLMKLSTIGSTDQDEAASTIQSIFRGNQARSSSAQTPSLAPSASTQSLKDVAQEVAVATIQSLVRGAGVRSKAKFPPRKPTLTKGAVDLIGDMINGAINNALSPREPPQEPTAIPTPSQDRRPTLQPQTATYISAMCGGAISEALMKSPETLKRGLGENEAMNIMGEARKRATTIMKDNNAVDVSNLKMRVVEESSSESEEEEEVEEEKGEIKEEEEIKFTSKAQGMIEDTINSVIKNALKSPVNSPVNQKRSTIIKLADDRAQARVEENLAMSVLGEAKRRATTILKGEDAVDMTKLKRKVLEESSSGEEEEEESEEVERAPTPTPAPEPLPPPSPKREKEKIMQVVVPVPPAPTEIPPEPEQPAPVEKQKEAVVEVVVLVPPAPTEIPPEPESRSERVMAEIHVPAPSPTPPPALKVEMDIPEPTLLKSSASPAKRRVNAEATEEAQQQQQQRQEQQQQQQQPPMTHVAFPAHTTPQTPLDQIVIIAHKQAFEKFKQSPTSLQCTEIVRILQALSLVKGRSLDSLLATCGIRTVSGKNDRFDIPIGGSLKDLKKALVKAWTDLEEGGCNNKNKSFTPELLKQTKKHLTDLLRLPKPALSFLQKNFNPETYTPDQVSKFFCLVGVKEQQFHQATCLHKTGDTLGEITAKAVDEASQVEVLRSSLLRRRILLGVEVIKIILQWKRAKAFESRGGDVEIAASPRTGNPFSGIVEDLRRSVGELQMTLHNKEHTITRLNDKVSRLEKKAADAGISLMSPEAHTQQPTTPSRRPLYRDENAETVGFLGSATKAGGEMVAVSKDMWEDSRVASPTKARNTSPVMEGAIEPKKSAHPLSSSFEKRRQLKTATAIFSPNSMTVTSFPQKNPPARFNEEAPPKPPSPTNHARATTAPGGPRGRPFARDVDIILGDNNNAESTRGIGGKTMTGLIRKGSPTKRTRPVSAGMNRPAKPPVQLAVGTSSKAKAILTDIWVDFQAGASPKREKKKKRRGRKISSTAGRTIGGIGEATKILDGFDSDSDSSNDNVVFGGEDDSLDNIVSGSYCEHDTNNENLQPPDTKPASSPNSPVRIKKTKKKKDRSMSPTQRRLDNINNDVTKAKNRLDKQLKLLRGRAFESDPKSAQEIVEDVRKKERARLKADGGGGGGNIRRPKSPLKGMFDNGVVVGEGGVEGTGSGLRVDGSEVV